MNLSTKILGLFSILNISSIFLIFLIVIAQNNNHFGFAIDLYFLVFSALLFLLSFLSLFKKLIFLNLLAIFLSLALHHFNIVIHYHKWIERAQPNIFDVDINITSIKLK